MRELSVRGKGTFKANPDLIQVNFSIIVLKKDYEEMMYLAGYNFNVLQNMLLEEGFSKDDIKTVKFEVTRKTEYIQNKHVFIGYQHRHDLRIEFDLDMNKLGRVLNVLNESYVEPNFNILFTIKDIEGAKDMILDKATADAFKKANILANASGVKIGNIQKITYTSDPINLVSDTVLRYNVTEASVQDAIDIVPEELDITDYVYFVFEIEN